MTESSDSDVDGVPPPSSCGSAPNAVDFARMRHKMDNLPTRAKLLQEEDPNAFTEAQLEEATCFVRDLLAAPLLSEQDVERQQRRLHKKYRQVFKKSLLLAAYKHLLAEGAPSASSTPEAAPPSKRQLRRAARRRRQGQPEETESNGSPLPLDMTTAAVAAVVQPVGDLEDLASLPSLQEGSRASADASSSTATPAAPPPPRVRVAPSPVLERFLVSKAPRSQSGVLVVTVFTSAYPDGQRFSCQWNCYYCPNEPNQPRSYLLNEPGVRRANLLDFDAYRQFTERVRSLVAIGHPADKVELLVLGGTWESYPLPYRIRFIRDLFYAANTFFDSDAAPHEADAAATWRRPPLDLLQEQLLNEHARCKIIGVTLETRPDTVNPAMLRELRMFGCTRVQLGVQHTDDAILAKVNRQATREDTMRAIKLLKDACFKVDIHLMPDLPGANPAIDKAMFDDVLHSPYLQADQWKIYPCQTTPFTVIEEWYKQGLYTPYGLENLIEVLLHAKVRVPPWIRLNRVVRDIPVDYVLAGVEVGNLRQLLAIKLAERGQRCRCIRCREVKGDKDVAEKLKTAVLKERDFEASEGTETFLSFETPDEATIFAFLRLRTAMRLVECPFPELDGCALIRELHVYGNLIPTYAAADDEHGEAGEDSIASGMPRERGSAKAQHTGLGSRLLARAEALATAAGYKRIAVISGVGVRGYYRRRGYRLCAANGGAYLIKELAAAEQREKAEAAVARDNRYMSYVAGAHFTRETRRPDAQEAPDSQHAQRPWDVRAAWQTWHRTLSRWWRQGLARVTRKREREE